MKFKIPYLLTIILLITGLSIAQSNLSIHGYLSQAFAVTDGNQIFGITEKGTFDYRNLALQFRYDYDEQTNLIIQFSHKRLGISPIMMVEEDIELDWAYFGYEAWDWFSIKVGKIQLPFGIYNEMRDVGVILPFYQVPYASYGEGNWMSETIDGATFAFFLFQDTDMPLSIEIYSGQWKWVEWLFLPKNIGGIELHVDEPDIKNAFGFQTWLETPFKGIRLGWGGYLGKITGGLSFGDEFGLGEERIYVSHYSLDGNWYDYYLKSESTNYFLTHNDIFAYSFYAQGGYRVVDSFFLNLQGGLYRAKGVPLPSMGFAKIDINYYEDYAVGLNYAYFSNLVFKIEGHWNKGFLLEDRYMDYYANNPYITKYAIFSISASF